MLALLLCYQIAHDVENGAKVGENEYKVALNGLFHAQSPETGHFLHARLWRVNRDVEVRR